MEKVKLTDEQADLFRPYIEQLKDGRAIMREGARVVRAAEQGVVTIITKTFPKIAERGDFRANVDVEKGELMLDFVKGGENGER